jgi:hypothetical protein
MSFSVSKTRLAAVTKELSMQWAQTKEYWTDAKRDEFDHKYMEELFSSVDAALSIIEQLDKVSHKIKSDCE